MSTITTTPENSAGPATSPTPVQHSAPSAAAIVGGPGALPTPPAPPASPVWRRPGPLLAFVLGAALGAVLVGGVWAATSIALTSSTFTLTGTMVLTDGVTSYPSPGCHGHGGYDDIDQGTSVTVYDAEGTVIATGSLGEGTLAASRASCAFPITVPAVPGGSDYYQVEVSHRGKITVQSADAHAGRIAVSLG